MSVVENVGSSDWVWVARLSGQGAESAFGGWGEVLAGQWRDLARSLGLDPARNVVVRPCRNLVSVGISPALERQLFGNAACSRRDKLELAGFSLF